MCRGLRPFDAGHKFTVILFTIVYFPEVSEIFIYRQPAGECALSILIRTKACAVNPI